MCIKTRECLQSKIDQWRWQKKTHTLKHDQLSGVGFHWQARSCRVCCCCSRNCSPESCCRVNSCTPREPGERSSSALGGQGGLTSTGRKAEQTSSFVNTSQPFSSASDPSHSLGQSRSKQDLNSTSSSPTRLPLPTTIAFFSAISNHTRSTQQRWTQKKLIPA